jgi:hypothetical protein
MPGENEAAPSSCNRCSVAEGIIDLTSEPAFRPIRRDRDRDGRWVIRYYLFDAADAAAFARKNVLAGSSRECGMMAPSARALTAEQRAAADLIFRRIEACAQVRFERVDRADRADVQLFAADFECGGLGQVRDYTSGCPQVVVANTVHIGTPADDWSEELTFEEGSVGYGTLLHELLHALGLSHPNNMSAYANGKNGSVMCYSGEGGPPSEDNDLGRYDIAALQYLYGEPP